MGVSYHTTSKIDEVLKIVRKWMDANRREPKNLRRNTTAFAHHTYNYSDNYMHLMVQDDTHWHPGQIGVWLSLSPAEEGKPIFVPTHGDPFLEPRDSGTPDPFAPPKQKTADESKAPKR